jgi:hypothetical protein
MVNVFRSYQQFQGVRGNFGALPSWARFILTLVALPGIVALALSALLFCVSLIALLLLTVPVYIALKRLTGSGGEPLGRTVVTTETSVGPADVIDVQAETVDGDPLPGRRHVEVRILGET